MIWKISHLVLRVAAIVFVVFMFPLTGYSQDKNNYELDNLNDLFDAHHHETIRYKSQSAKPKNELEFVMASGFNIYKAFFSSQDNPSCVFYPSCSEYTVEVIQKKGLFTGTLQAFDRLSRCHRLVGPNQYYFNPTKQRFYDPVR